MRQVVATGVPRSGTKYLANLLGWGHEIYYGPKNHDPANVGEVSWMALPYLDPDRDLIIHIVRHPLKVLTSNIHRNWLNPDNIYGKFANHHSSTWDIYEFYLFWISRAIYKAHVTIRLEDIEHLSVPKNKTISVFYPTPIIIPKEYRSSIIDICQRFKYDQWDL